MLLFAKLFLAFGIQTAAASTLRVLTAQDVTDAVTLLRIPPATPLGGCSIAQVAIVKQAYTDAVTLANLASSSLSDGNRPPAVTGMFDLLFNPVRFSTITTDNVAREYIDQVRLQQSFVDYSHSSLQPDRRNSWEWRSLNANRTLR